MRIVIATANHSGRDRNLKIEDVALVSSDAVGDFLNELLGIPWLPAPLGQNVACQCASVVLISRLKFVGVLEESALLRYVPFLVLGHGLHGEIPLRTLGGKGRGVVKNSLGFGGAFCE